MDVNWILLEELLGRRLVKGTGDCSNVDVYMRIDQNSRAYGKFRLDRYQFQCYTARCPGGAWSSFGNGTIKDDHVILELKTIRNLVYRKTGTETYRYDFVDPGFPDNMLEFLAKAAINARKALDLGHTRMWQGQRRRFRNREAT